MSADHIPDDRKKVPAVAGPLQRTVGRPAPKHYPLEVECLHDDDCRTLMSQGHHLKAEFLAACERWYGRPLAGWGKVRHVWLRTVPDRSGDYQRRMFPAKPHTRGAYPATTIVDDPSYDSPQEGKAC